MDLVAEILEKDFSAVYKNRPPDQRSRRPILSPERSLGSVIKLFTPSPEYTDEHKSGSAACRRPFASFLFTVKRYYRPEWGDNWREHFTVDRVNGLLGPRAEVRQSEARQQLPARRATIADGSWRIYKLRPDFYPAEKVQVEDDITASVVLPARQPQRSRPRIPATPASNSSPTARRCSSSAPTTPSTAASTRQAEVGHRRPRHLSLEFEPLTVEQAARSWSITWPNSTSTPSPMKRLLAGVSSTRPPPRQLRRLLRASAHRRRQALQESALPPEAARPRRIRAKPISPKSPRASSAKFPPISPCYFPVNAVLAGRRNNPADPAIGLPPLAVYNPIHYQELPELFMEFISQPHRQIALHHRLRQRGRAHQRPVQRALAGGRSEQRAGLRDPDRLRRLHHLRRLRRAACIAWITTSACSCRRSGAACGCTSASRNS